MNPSRAGLRLLRGSHASCTVSGFRSAAAARPFSHSPARSSPSSAHRATGDAAVTATSTSASSAAAAAAATPPELDVGEIEGASFRVEPLRRVGEDIVTMRARLQYQSRKRGILESDLLLSTFADANLAGMSRAQLEQYDLFLDENDWDIYYWATQAAPAGDAATTTTTTTTAAATSASPSPSGEWAQTIGRFKPAYRPVPARWKDSEILGLLRKHVRERSAGGVVDDVDDVPAGSKGAGLGRMPEVQVYE